MKLDISVGGISVRGWIIRRFSIQMYDQIDYMAVGYVCRIQKACMYNFVSSTHRGIR